MKTLISFLLAITVAICFTRAAVAAEHPGAPAGHTEHPGKTHAEEHPGKKEMLSASEIIKGIKDHIDNMTKSHGGYYPLRDDKDNKDLRLKFVKIHEDKVSYIKKDKAYFACTDFVTEDGKTAYDVDFWMKKDFYGKLKVYKTKIHKKDGEPRFTYKEDEIVPVE